MRSRWIRKIPALLICMASLIASHSLLPQDFAKLPGGSALDAQGIRHHWSDYGGRMAPPWIRDAIFSPRPAYVYEARTRRIMGSGLFRLTLDLRTGNVVKVTTVKSTGSLLLDNPAVSAFEHWRFNPGRWKEIDLPITFTIASGPPRVAPRRWRTSSNHSMKPAPLRNAFSVFATRSCRGLSCSR
jgi:TonB family protein